MTRDDIAYYQKRARDEQARAETCNDSAAGRAHLQMAQEYDRRVREDASMIEIGSAVPNRMALS